MRFQGSQAIKAYIPSELRRRGWGSGALKGKNSQGDKKNRCLINKFLPDHADNSFWYTKSSLLISVFLVQVPYLNSFRQLKGRWKSFLTFAGSYLIAFSSKQATCQSGTFLDVVFCSPQIILVISSVTWNSACLKFPKTWKKYF